MDEDHVHGVAGRVVQVAGDPPALLCGREPALSLRLALRPHCALLERSHPLAPQACSVTGKPDAGPEGHAEQHPGVQQLAARDQVAGEDRDHESHGERQTGPRRSAGCRHPVERQRGPERRAVGIRDQLQPDAGEPRYDENGERRPPGPEDRQRGEHREQHPRRAELAALGVLARDEQADRSREHADRDRGVEQEIVAAAVLGGHLGGERSAPPAGRNRPWEVARGPPQGVWRITRAGVLGARSSTYRGRP